MTLGDLIGFLWGVYSPRAKASSCRKRFNHFGESLALQDIEPFDVGAKLIPVVLRHGGYLIFFVAKERRPGNSEARSVGFLGFDGIFELAGRRGRWLGEGEGEGGSGDV